MVGQRQMQMRVGRDTNKDEKRTSRGEAIDTTGG